MSAGVSLLAIVCCLVFTHRRSNTAKTSWQRLCGSVTLLVVATLSWNLSFEPRLLLIRSFWWPAPTNAVRRAQSAVKQRAGTFIETCKTLADLDTELAEAQAANQYVLVDLFAEWCVACKEFEHITFADAGVKS